jgi:16S rRNA (cytosine967-C5)-methyltransferase
VTTLRLPKKPKSAAPPSKATRSGPRAAVARARNPVGDKKPQAQPQRKPQSQPKPQSKAAQAKPQPQPQPQPQSDVVTAAPRARTPAAQRADVSRLADDSLARVFLLATPLVGAVLAGQSLTNARPDSDLAALPPPLRAQVHELVYGVLRRHGWGDALLARLLDKPVLEKPVRALLLLALYRLDTRPESAYAIVDNAVDAAGIISQGKAGGLVNAVLRNFLRRRSDLLVEIERDLAVQFQHPAWWLRHLRNDFPTDWKSICKAGNEQPPLTLRVNTRRTTREAYLERLASAGIPAEALAEFPSAIRLLQSVRIDALPGFTEGLFAVQDAGAQRAAEWLDLADGQCVLDACAAPGGKSGHILQIAAVDLLALDIDAQRCRRVEENLGRLGLAATVRAGDAAQPADWWDGRPFDRILLDAPCSASGVVRRHPDVKWLRRAADIPALARTQRTMLDALWPTLAPGGRLLYATCSVFRDENWATIEAFLAAHSDAESIALAENDALGLQLLPNAIHDGFFYALLTKTA